MLVLEAMALERPVVASAVGGISEVVADGETGLLVPPDDPRSLAAAVLELLEDTGRAAAMGRAGLSRVIDHFSLDDQMRRYLAVFRSSLAEVRRPA